MKAAVVKSFDRPLEIEERPIPEPDANGVLVRIEASGLCHTDIHAARGEWPVKASPPFVPGHEGVGIIERVGPSDVYGLEPGMRVALPWLGYACAVSAATATAAARRCARRSPTPASEIGATSRCRGCRQHLYRPRLDSPRRRRAKAPTR